MPALLTTPQAQQHLSQVLNSRSYNIIHSAIACCPANLSLSGLGHSLNQASILLAMNTHPRVAGQACWFCQVREETFHQPIGTLVTCSTRLAFFEGSALFLCKGRLGFSFGLRLYRLLSELFNSQCSWPPASCNITRAYAHEIIMLVS